MTDFPTVDLAPPFLKVEKVDDHEQMMSDVLEEIELKRECVPLLAQLRDTAVIGEQRKELIRILRLKRNRLKVLNPSLFMRSEFDEEHEKIISDVVEEIELKRECGPLLAQLHDNTVKRKELIRILRLKRDRLKVLNPSLFAFKKSEQKSI